MLDESLAKTKSLQESSNNDSFDSHSWGNGNTEQEPDKTNNPQEEFEFSTDQGKNERSTLKPQEPKRVVVDNLYDFKNVVAKAASKGETGLKMKKTNLVAFKTNVSNKLAHIFNISKNLQNDIRLFFESPQFIVGNEPCLSEKPTLYNGILQEI